MLNRNSGRGRGLLIRWSKTPEDHRTFHHLSIGIIACKPDLAADLARWVQAISQSGSERF
jgi:hypothetical protein